MTASAEEARTHGIKQSGLLFLEAPITGAAPLLFSAAARLNLPITLLAKRPERYTEFYGDLSAYHPQLTIVQIETENSSQVEEWAEMHGERFSAIICLSDFCIDIAARVAEQQGWSFYSPDAISTLTNKERAAKCFAELGISTPRSWPLSSLSDVADDTPFPCILKSSRGTGSMGVAFCEKYEDLELAWPSVASVAELNGGTVLLQEFIPGPLLSAEVLISAGQSRVLGYTSRTLGPHPSFIERSASFPVALPTSVEKQMQAYVSSLCEALRLNEGFLHIEFVLRDAAPVIIEVNARLGGSLIGALLSHAFNSDIFELLIRLSHGEEVSLPDSPQGGAALTLLYAPRGGRIHSVSGEAVSRYYPGVQSIVWHTKVGRTIGGPEDFRGCFATMLATGSSAYLAHMNVEAAATALRVVVD